MEQHSARPYLEQQQLDASVAGLLCRHVVEFLLLQQIAKVLQILGLERRQRAGRCAGDICDKRYTDRPTQ